MVTSSKTLGAARHLELMPSGHQPSVLTARRRSSASMIMLGTLMPASLGVPAYPLLSTRLAQSQRGPTTFLRFFCDPQEVLGFQSVIRRGRKNPSEGNRPEPVSR